MEASIDESYAEALDSKDPLSQFRSRFHIPPQTIYLNGNSLGLAPKDAEVYVQRALSEWKQLAISGWWQGSPPWLEMGEHLGKKIAPMMGADPDEVVATGTTTFNIHSLISAFFSPRGKRRKILTDTLNFPSDLYALQGQLRMRDMNPETDLIYVQSADGITLDEEEIISHFNDDIALVFLPSVLYRSGQLLDIARLTKEAHARGIPIGFDCCHSAGAMRHFLDEWDVDFAVWCSYKYLCSGPGSSAFLYLNRRHFDLTPKLPGWFGFEKSRQFEMLLTFEHHHTASGYQVSSTSILSAAPISAALNIFNEANIDSVRAKSLTMTDYLIFLADNLLDYDGIVIETPREWARRSGHVAIRLPGIAKKITETLANRNVIVDYRRPDVIRITPSALYNTYHEVWQTVQIIKTLLSTTK